MTRSQAFLAQIAAAQTYWVLLGLQGFWRAHGIRLPREVADALQSALDAAEARARG